MDRPKSVIVFANFLFAVAAGGVGLLASELGKSPVREALTDPIIALWFAAFLFLVLVGIGILKLRPWAHRAATLLAWTVAPFCALYALSQRLPYLSAISLVAAIGSLLYLSQPRVKQAFGLTSGATNTLQTVSVERPRARSLLALASRIGAGILGLPSAGLLLIVGVGPLLEFLHLREPDSSPGAELDSLSCVLGLASVGLGTLVLLIEYQDHKLEALTRWTVTALLELGLIAIPAYIGLVLAEEAPRRGEWGGLTIGMSAFGAGCLAFASLLFLLSRWVAKQPG